MHDPTESTRRQMMTEINANPGSRESLETKHGLVWDTTELQEDYEVLAFMAPFVIVMRKADRVKGSLAFQATPRFYYQFEAD